MAERLHNEQNLEPIGAGERQNQQTGSTVIWRSIKYTFHMEKIIKIKSVRLFSKGVLRRKG